jgi:hypothetical protein
MDRIMEKFATPGPVSVVLDIPAGSVRLIAADRADTVVEVLPADASKRRDMKAAQQIEVGRDGVVSIAPLRSTACSAAPAHSRRAAGRNCGRIDRVHRSRARRVEPVGEFATGGSSAPSANQQYYLVLQQRLGVCAGQRARGDCSAGP